MKATVLGASGFVGRSLVRHLRALGYDVAAPGRGELAQLRGNLGRVFYCIGMTGNFRGRPLATVEAHAGVLGRVLERIDCESFLYFSSTRVYAKAQTLAETSEDQPVRLLPSADSLYETSKLLGEALCLARDDPAFKVLRLSNVYGPGQSAATFLGSLLRDLATDTCATIRETRESSKDYIAVDDVIALAVKIAHGARHRLYNVASGQPVCHREIARVAVQEGYSCDFAPSGTRRVFPPIDTTRLTREFGFTPRALLNDLPQLLRIACASTNKTAGHEAVCL